MRRRTARDGPKPIPRRPTPQDFTGNAALRAVIKETVQHPATILPVALGVAAGLLTIITREPAIFLAALTLVGIGGSAWIYNFGVRGKTLAERYIATQRELQKEYDRRAIERLRTECEEIGWNDGAKEARELHEAYLAAKKGLSDRDATSADLLRFEALTEQALNEGIELLGKGVATYRALARINVRVLERERNQFGKQLSVAEIPDADRRALEEQVASHTRTIDLYRRNEGALTELIAKVNALGNALEQVNLTAARGARSNLFGSGGAAAQLELAVSAAARAEDRLRELGSGERPEDEEYARIGRNTRHEAS